MSGPTLKSASHLYLLPLVALLATTPLLVHGCSCGHDFDFHLLSWFEAAAQIAHGNLHPHWAFSPAWNAGEPRFVFYPPLSWYLGALLGLIMPWTWTPMVYTWLVLSAAGLACHRLLRHFAGAATALPVSALYIVNPYMLFTGYERTAYAELLATVWLPLLLLGILRNRPTIPDIALPLALLWLTNAPAAVLGTYSLALLAFVRLAMMWVPHLRHSLTVSKVGSTELARTTLAGTALGLGLAAFYILPAAYERRYVEIALVNAPGMSFADNFLFTHTADAAHDAVLHTASVLAVCLLTLTATALLAAFFSQRSSRATLLPLTSLTAAIALLLTPLSAPIWRHAPELAFLQFPWRFLAILAPVLALALAMAIRKRRTLPIQGLGTLVLVAALIAGSVHLFFQRCDSEDTVGARLLLFRNGAGTEPTDEYTPNTEDEDALGQHNPPYWMAANADAPAPADLGPDTLRWPIELTTPIPEALILNLRDFPAWHLLLNGHLISERLERPDGLIAFPVPAGHSTLTAIYARTPDQTAGEVISVVSVAALLYLLYRRRR